MIKSRPAASFQPYLQWNVLMLLIGHLTEDMVKAMVAEGAQAAELEQLSRVDLEKTFQEYTQLWMRRGEDQATAFRQGSGMEEVLDLVLHGDGHVKDIIKVATDQNLELKNATVMIGGLLIEHASQSYNSELKDTYQRFEPAMREHIEKRRTVEAQSEEERTALPPHSMLAELSSGENLPPGLQELQVMFLFAITVAHHHQ